MHRTQFVQRFSGIAFLQGSAVFWTYVFYIVQRFSGIAFLQGCSLCVTSGEKCPCAG